MILVAGCRACAWHGCRCPHPRGAGAAALYRRRPHDAGRDLSETLSFSRLSSGAATSSWPSVLLTACALTLGLPSILTLFRKRNRLGLVAIGVFVIGCLGIAGYAMLLVFMRALAVTHSTAVSDLSGVR